MLRQNRIVVVSQERAGLGKADEGRKRCRSKTPWSSELRRHRGSETTGRDRAGVRRHLRTVEEPRLPAGDADMGFGQGTGVTVTGTTAEAHLNSHAHACRLFS